APLGDLIHQDVPPAVSRIVADLQAGGATAQGAGVPDAPPEDLRVAAHGAVGDLSVDQKGDVHASVTAAHLEGDGVPLERKGGREQTSGGAVALLDDVRVGVGARLTEDEPLIGHDAPRRSIGEGVALSLPALEILEVEDHLSLPSRGRTRRQQEVLDLADLRA